MIDLEIILDESLPTHVVFVSLSPDGARHAVTVSPQVEPNALGVLQPEVGLAVADAIDGMSRRDGP